MESLIKSFWLWFDTKRDDSLLVDGEKINFVRCMPYFLIHVGCIAVLYTGVSLKGVIICLVCYAFRVLALTGFYHRYFAHRAFKTSRSLQFLFAFLGATAAQRGPIWWAAHHRHHHKHSDGFADEHSPKMHGFLVSHFIWFIKNKNFATNEKFIKDFAKYPELVFLNRFDFIPPLILVLFLYQFFGLTGVVWGFFISTVLVYHVTFLVNSFAHIKGTRKFDTKDNSHNNWWLAILTFGEGWHNNHHHYPSSARQGFLWYEIDITYYFLKLLSKLGMIWELREPNAELLHVKQ